MVQNAVRYALAAAVLAVGLVVSSVLISHFFVRVQQEKEIHVTGYAESTVIADLGQLEVSVYVEGADRAGTYKAVRQQADAIADACARAPRTTPASGWSMPTSTRSTP